MVSQLGKVSKQAKRLVITWGSPQILRLCGHGIFPDLYLQDEGDPGKCSWYSEAWWVCHHCILLG